jgi:hypothetical protein
MPELMMYTHFPRAREVDAGMYPSYEEVLACFASGGFAVEALDTVRFQIASSGREAFERFRLRAISTFEFLDEDEIEAGFASMEAALAHGDQGPVIEEASLLTVVRGT